MSSLEAAFNQLPAPIVDKLQSMINRVRRLLFIRGLCATIASALVCLLLIMAIDASFTLFSSSARWALSLAALGVTLATAWWFLVRPLSRKFTLTHMARILEIRHPELQERISTAVELLSSEDPESVRGSEELIGAVVESAVEDVDTVDPRSEFRPAKATKFIIASGICLAIVLLLLAIWPRQSWTLLTRALAPHLDIGNAWASSLVIEPGDIRIAKSSPVTIEVSVKHKRLKRAEVRRKLQDGTESIERMTLIGEEPDGTKKFSLTFPNVDENFAYRVRAGSAVSEFYQVSTVDPPAVEHLTVTYDYPEYTGLEDGASPSETGEIRAVQHTKVKVTAQLNKPAWTAKLYVNEANEMGTPLVEENTATWEFELLAGLNGTWRIELTDEEGFSNEPVEHPITSLPDKPPIVQIYNPVLRELRLKPTERLPIESTVVEDFGFSDVALLVTPQGAKEPQVILQSLPTPTNRAENYQSSASLDLSSLELEEGQNRIGVQVQVRDNRPTDYEGPGTGTSETIFITLDKKARSLADQAIEAQRREIEEQVREAKRELERARDEMRRTEQELSRSNEVNERARERLDEFSERTDSARNKLDQIAATLNNSMFQPQSDKARSLAESPVSEAREKADLIPVTDEKQERLAEARQSREKIEEAIRGVDDLAKEMRSAEDDYRAISKLNDLANRQQELAMQANDLAEKNREEASQNSQRDEQAQRQIDQQQRRELEQFRKQQQQVAQQLGQMLKDNQAALAEVLEQEKQRAENLAQQAQALAEQQENLRNINEAALSEKGDAQTPLTEELLNQLEKMQSALAEDAAAKAAAEKEAASNTAEQNSEDSAKQQQELTASLEQSAEQAKQAAEGLKEKNLDQAKQAASQAKDSLAQAAQQEANKETTQDASSTEGEKGEPESKSNEASSSSELAERQEAISEQIEAIQRGDLQEALAAMEEQLNREAESLQDQTDGFEETLQNLQQNAAKSQADRAEKLVDQGGKKASEASKQFSQAQQNQSRSEERGEVQEGEISRDTRNSMQRGKGSQEQSQNLFQQAAQSLAQSSESIGQTMDGLEPSDMDERITNSEDLAKGFDEVSESSQSENSSEAAQKSQQAASSLQQLAQAAMQQLGNPPNPNQPQGQQQPPMTMGEPDTLTLNESGEKTADIDGSGIPPELQNMGISAEDWARFKGALIGGNATAIETELPAEYRELVGRYFQVIAKEAAAR